MSSFRGATLLLAASDTRSICMAEGLGSTFGIPRTQTNHEQPISVDICKLCHPQSLRIVENQDDNIWKHISNSSPEKIWVFLILVMRQDWCTGRWWDPSCHLSHQDVFLSQSYDVLLVKQFQSAMTSRFATVFHHLWPSLTKRLLPTLKVSLASSLRKSSRFSELGILLCKTFLRPLCNSAQQRIHVPLTIMYSVVLRCAVQKKVPVTSWSKHYKRNLSKPRFRTLRPQLPDANGARGFTAWSQATAEMSWVFLCREICHCLLHFAAICPTCEQL